MEHITPRPSFDPIARKHMDDAIKERFITTAERKARVQTALTMVGYDTLADLARAMGVQNEWLYKILAAPQPSLLGIQRLAVGLSVTVAYLTERKF